MDMLWLEMMKDEEHAFRAIEAAVASGLPMCVGISARTDKETGAAVLWADGEASIPLSTEWCATHMIALLATVSNRGGP